MSKRTLEQKRYYATGEGQKRLMRESVGQDYDMRPLPRPTSDYGADPIGDGTFRMVPSGDIVDFAERMRRLPERVK